MPTLPLLVSYTLFPDTVHPLTPPADDHVVSPALSLAVSTYPLIGVCAVMVKFVVRNVPLTSSFWPGHADPIPTLPLPTIRLPPAAVHVPMPTLPLATAKAVCNADVPMPTLPLTISPFAPTICPVALTVPCTSNT